MGRALRRGGLAAGIRPGGQLRLIAALALALLALLAAAAPARAEAVRLVHGQTTVVHWPGDEGVARRVMNAAQATHSFPGLPADAELWAGTIVLAPSQAVWDSVTGGRAPHWSAGVAIPAQRLIVLPLFGGSAGGTRDPIVTLRHELAHLALDAYLPRPIPRWFNEGYATWVSGEWDAGSGWQIRVAFLLRRAPPLDSLELGWPAGADRARLAYLLSASAVRYMAERGGERGFTELLAAWQRTGSLDRALRSTYGMTIGHFESEWVQHVRRRYGWLLMASQVGVFWAAAALFVLLMFGHRMRDNRRRIEEMEREYRMLPPPSPHNVEYPVAED
jgi:hypothetical protein